MGKLGGEGWRRREVGMTREDWPYIYANNTCVHCVRET